LKTQYNTYEAYLRFLKTYLKIIQQRLELPNLKKLSKQQQKQGIKTEKFHSRHGWTISRKGYEIQQVKRCSVLQ
jgi:hypothetical protein